MTIHTGNLRSVFFFWSAAISERDLELVNEEGCGKEIGTSARTQPTGNKFVMNMTSTFLPIFLVYPALIQECPCCNMGV